MLLISLICHNPIVIRGQHVNLSSFSRWNVRNNRSWCVPFLILEWVLTRWRCLVAFVKGDARGILQVHCNGHQNGQQWTHLHPRFVCCCSGCRPRQYGASSRPMVASSGFRLALDMLHRVKPNVSLQRLTMAIEMARNGGAFVCRRRLYCLA